MALTLSVGFVVDDAIVMLENIVRHMEMGKPRMQAALDGSKEISFTIISMTVSLAAVFIPILFMGGIVGRLMHEFAVTIGVAILVSGLVSLTLTPMLCSRFLKPLHSMDHGWAYNAVERTFEAWLKSYAWTLKQTIRFKPVTMLVSALLLAGTVYLFGVVPKGFIPSVDTGQISGGVEFAQGVGYDNTVLRMRQIMEILRNDPNVAAFTGDSGGGRLNVDLKPRDQRDKTADQIIEELRPKLNRVPGVRVTLSNPPAIRIGGGPGGGRGGGGNYQIALQDPDTDELYRVAPQFETGLREIAGLQDISSDLQLRTPQLSVDLDREQIAALGLTVDQVQSALSAAYSSRQVSQIYAPDDQYQVMMQVAQEYQQNPAALSMLYVQGSGNRLIPLSAVVTTRQTVGPQSINHIGQLPSVTLSFNLQPGVALGDALARVQEMARQTLPATVTPQGTAQAFEESMRGLGLILALAIFVIYVVLGILYESFIHPLTILSGLPSAGFGALLTLLIFKADLDIYAFVGIIMLVGLVKKNGIMMIDFAIERRKDGDISPADAIYEACLVRFRPIMMTTMAALMGTLPIALGWGAGAEARRPLGLAVVGGLLVSQTLTLYVTPVFYVYMEQMQDRMKRRKTAKAPVLAGAATAK
jgi:hydrophobic/amphiphilic exporter-1 (mainly G- bacteria), HAE1 family